MGPYCDDVLVLRSVNPASKREDEVRGKIIDVYADRVRAHLYGPGKPAYTSWFKKSQLRPGGARTWRVTVIMPDERSAPLDNSVA
jgi:hypothetical protein